MTNKAKSIIIPSAFIKSMRASQPDAALYYLARMIDAGEDPKFIARRMVVFASEDVGMAQPTALVVANGVFEAVEKSVCRNAASIWRTALYIYLHARKTGGHTKRIWPRRTMLKIRQSAGASKNPQRADQAYERIGLRQGIREIYK